MRAPGTALLALRLLLLATGQLRPSQARARRGASRGGPGPPTKAPPGASKCAPMTAPAGLPSRDLAGIDHRLWKLKPAAEDGAAAGAEATPAVSQWPKARADLKRALEYGSKKELFWDNRERYRKPDPRG